MRMLVAALVAAFALSSMAEAATPKKTRHRVKHSSRVASGAAVTTAKNPAAKKKAPATASMHAKANAMTQQHGVKKAPAKRPPTTKPH